MRNLMHLKQLLRGLLFIIDRGISDHVYGREYSCNRMISSLGKPLWLPFLYGALSAQRTVKAVKLDYILYS